MGNSRSNSVGGGNIPTIGKAKPAHDCVALTGEAPVWDSRRATLWWLDIQGQRLFGHRPCGSDWPEIPLASMPGLIAIADDGDLVLGLEDGLWCFSPELRRAKLLNPVETDQPQHRINDGKADAAGRLWFGTMDKTGSGKPTGSLYCRTVTGEIVQVLSAVTVPNSICVSPEGDRLYFADTPTGKIWVHDLTSEPYNFANARVFADYGGDGIPDGACVDATGGLWVAVIGKGRIDQFSPDGTLIGKYALPVSRPTMPCFGGSDFSTLFVTSTRRSLGFEQLLSEPSAGKLLALSTGVGGVKPFTVQIEPAASRAFGL